MTEILGHVKVDEIFKNNFFNAIFQLLQNKNIQLKIDFNHHPFPKLISKQN